MIGLGHVNFESLKPLEKPSEIFTEIQNFYPCDVLKTFWKKVCPLYFFKEMCVSECNKISLEDLTV